ncbi:ATP-binding protein [Aliarcobacter butzleri]|nr:ATP-binding protein [Aliarcobacter butzleri]
MRLLFIYFYKDFGTFEKGSIIHLSKKYKFSIDKEKSTENEFYFNKEENPNFIDDFYSKNIDIGVLIGENGTGKSVLINSIKDYMQNDRTIAIYEMNGEFFYNYYTYGNRNITIYSLGRKYIVKEINIKNIFYTSTLDLGRKVYQDGLDISDKAFLTKYENKTFEKSLKLIENDDILKYFKLVEKHKKKELIPDFEELKMEFSEDFFLDINKYILNNYRELIKDYSKNIKEFIIHIEDLELVKFLFIDSFKRFDKEIDYINRGRLISLLITATIFCDDIDKFKNFINNYFPFDIKIEELITNIHNSFEEIDILKDYNFPMFPLTNTKSYTLKYKDIKFVEFYNKFIRDSKFNFMQFEIFPPLSSGQKAILFIFARINDAIQKINQENPNENILILLDEADLKLHLEWQRKFLCDLIKFLNSYPNNKFYILYATHSPMILSDITNDRVVFLEKDKITELSKDKQEINDKNELKIKSTFGANIYDIYSDSFFVNNFMGAFAQNKINEVIKIIDEYKEKKEKNPDEFMPNEKALDNLKIVKSIGEPLLRNKLEDEIKSLVKDDIMEIVNNLKNKKNEEIEKELEKYSQFTQTKVLMKLLEIRK